MSRGLREIIRFFELFGKENVKMYQIFERLLEQKGVSTAEVSKATGIAKSTLSSWKAGTSTPKADKLYLIAKFFEVPMEIFFEDDDEKSFAQRYEELREKYFNVNVKGFSPVFDVAAGEGCINGDYANEFLADNADDAEYSFCTVHGDSMYPILHDGDVVKVRHQTLVTDKDIAIVKVDGETATAKYVEVVDNGVWIRAENKDVFEDRFYTVQEVLSLPITIIGRVAELRREFR